MWNEILHDTLFIGHSSDDLSQEIRTNTWHISMSAKERASASREELLNFFSDVMNNRRQQIQDSHSDHGMWFYVWHDQQASQLRFSLISDFHTHLPFGATTAPETLETIIDEFLTSNDHIPFSALDMQAYNAEEQKPEDDISTFVLPVLKVQLL